MKKIFGLKNAHFLCALFALINFVIMIVKYHANDLNGIVLYGFMSVFMILLCILTKVSKK